jgi:hypothetical protein
MPKLKKRITVYFCLINLRDHRVEMVVMIQLCIMRQCINHWLQEFLFDSKAFGDVFHCIRH